MSDKQNYPRLITPALGVMVVTAAALLLALQAHESNPIDSPTAQWIEQWTPAQPFILPKRALAAAALNGFLYVIGGERTRRLCT